MMKSWLAMGFGALALVSASVSAATAEPYGTWKLGKQGKVTLEVFDCGGLLCAKIVGLAEPNRNGKPKVDRHNKNESLRSRPLMGLVVAQGLKADGANKWKGKVYNADDGNTYAATISQKSESVMNLKGCVLGGLLCESTKMFKQ